MADRPRFGPAGVPSAFKALKSSVFDVPKYLHDEGLDAFEYQAVRWGSKPQMKKEDAEKLGINAGHRFERVGKEKETSTITFSTHVVLLFVGIENWLD